MAPGVLAERIVDPSSIDRRSAMHDGATEATTDRMTETGTIPTRQRPLELHGKVAIVTGAAKGMGGSICVVLADEGAAWPGAM
jgi:hypothetical protein